MFSEVRQQEIYQLVREQKKVKVSQLAKQFNVTLETIRNDLKVLESQGLINRVHGGAVLGKQEIKKMSKFSEDFDISCLLRDLLIKNEEAKDNSIRVYEGKVCILGSFIIDIIANVDHFPKVGELIYSNSNALSPGGKGTNQALSASCSGSRVHLITKVGNDPFNKYAYKHLKESGIDSFTIFQSDTEPTGSSVTYLAEETKNNITASYFGANSTFIEQEIDTSLPYISESDVFLVQGEVNIDAIERAVKFAHEIGKDVILNVAPYSEELKRLYRFVDYITLNMYQSGEWAGIKVNDIQSAKEAAKIVAGEERKKVIINLDGLGVVYFDGKISHHIAALPSITVDTMGSCDAFNGAFASEIAKGKPINEAVLFANAFVSAFIEQKGVTRMPNISNVLARLKFSKTNNIKQNYFCSETRCEI
ncbi:PfkB family carbohydrate kinase [Vibrio sp. JC009]|uniref:PfkB family carbohydrate kinase n=1 Tax=Vibrio sp. JC009 TaxID=2912314 RepID=UPI0023B04293|nr:PfkB family carbohydrate kinase [Vibrio sp. JC009]WED24028.1 PfkB family carbohydrate kinase [Vibrio sp. JC009]